MRLSLGLAAFSAAAATLALLGASLEPDSAGAIPWHAGLRVGLGFLGSSALGAAWGLVARRPVASLPFAALLLSVGVLLGLVGAGLALRMSPDQLVRSAVSWFPLDRPVRLFDAAVVSGAALSISSAALLRLRSGARYGRRMLLLLVGMEAIVAVVYLLVRLFASPSLMQAFGVALTAVSAIGFWALLRDWRATGVGEGAFSLLFRSLPVPAAAIDLHTDAAVLNPPAEAIFGRCNSAQAVVHRLGFRLTPEALFDLHAGRRFTDLRIPGAPGRIFELQLHLDARRAIGVLVLLDVTERVEHAAELARTLGDLQRMQDRLLINEKMAAIGVLVAGVSHEINNPLAYTSANLRSLQTTLRELLDGVPLARKVAASGEGVEELRAWTQRDGVCDAELDALDAVREAAEGCARIQETVSSMRLLSRREEAVQSTDLTELTRAGLKLGRTSLASEVQVVSSLEGPLPVRGAAGELTRVVTNLIVNAGQALGARGRLELRAWADGRTAVVEVSDDGPGVPPEMRARVFEPFFTTKASGEGTGLGLAISFETARRHGGELLLVERPGPGATFQLRVPLAAEDAPEEPPLPHAA